MASNFVPKQFIPMDPAWMMQSELARNHERVARVILEAAGSIPPNARILDNLSGVGPVSQVAVELCPPDARATLHIDAVDSVPPIVDMLNGVAAKEGWPLKAHAMAAEKLDFPDATFTHVITSFGLPIAADPQAAASEMYRTLKPGGFAATSMYSWNPIGDNLTIIRREKRGLDRKYVTEAKGDYKTPDATKAQLASGGFAKDNIQIIERTYKADITRPELSSLYGYINEPASGWDAEDEAQWDASVDEAFAKIKTEPSCEELDGGRLRFDVPVLIAIARK